MRRVCVLGLMLAACGGSEPTPDMPGPMDMSRGDMSEDMDVTVEEDVPVARPDITPPPTEVVLEPEQLVVGFNVENFVQVPAPTFTFAEVPICQDVWVWEAEDEDVATVEGGRMTVVGVGVTRVWARCGDFEGSAWFAVAPMSQARIPELRLWLHAAHGVELGEDGRVRAWRNFAPGGGRFVLEEGGVGAEPVEVGPEDDAAIQELAALAFRGGAGYRLREGDAPRTLRFEEIELWMLGRRRGEVPGTWLEGELGASIGYGGPGRWIVDVPPTWEGEAWPRWETETLALGEEFTVASLLVEDSKRAMFQGQTFATLRTTPKDVMREAFVFTPGFVREGGWEVTRFGAGLEADVVEVLGLGVVPTPDRDTPRTQEYLRARLWPTP